MLMGELATFVNALEHRTDLTARTVELWTMGQYMDHVFPVRPPTLDHGGDGQVLVWASDDLYQCGRGFHKLQWQAFVKAMI